MSARTARSTRTPCRLIAISRLVAFALLLGTAGISVADPPADPNAARLAEIQLRKAELELRKAELDYANALPASGLTNSVTVNQGSGQIEASILFARSLDSLATSIYENVKDQCGGTIVPFAGASPQVLTRPELFELRVRRVKDGFDAGAAVFMALQKQYEDLTDTRRTVTTENLAMVSAGATVGLNTLNKLFSYAASDYSVGPVTISADDTLLVAAVAAKSSTIFLLPQQLSSDAAAHGVMATIESLDAQSLETQAGIAKSVVRVKDLKERAKSAAEPRKSELEQLASAFEGYAETAKTYVAGYDTLVADLTADPEKNPLALASVVRERAISDALKPNGCGLFLKIDVKGGSYYTKKNLWTAFGAMPFYVSGGAVVSYTLVSRKDSRVLKAGALHLQCRFRKVSEIAGGTDGTCEAVHAKK